MAAYSRPVSLLCTNGKSTEFHMIRSFILSSKTDAGSPYSFQSTCSSPYNTFIRQKYTPNSYIADSITALNGKLGYDANETMVTLNGWSIHYRNAGAGFIYVNITRTIQKLESSSTYIEITNLPFTVAFVQHLPITNLVAHSVVGNGIANFYGRTLACRYQEYGAAVSNEIAGLLRVV